MKKLKGFTLIELLIVIIIIGILATIAIVAYNSATAKAKRSAVVQTLDDGIKGAATCNAAGETTLTVLPGSTCSNVSITTAVWPTIAASAATAPAAMNGYYNKAGTAVAAATLNSSGGYDYGTITLTNGTATYDISCSPNNNCKAVNP